MMLRIAICDDQPDFSAYLRQIVLQTSGYDRAEVRQFYHAQALLDSLQDQMFASDIAIVDMHMIEAERIAFTGLINSLAPCCQVIFLSSYSEHDPSAYVVEHIHYILKSKMEERLALALNKAAEKLRIALPQTIIINKRAASYRITESDIAYLERVLRKTRIMAQGEEYWTKRTPDELLDEIDDRNFLRCHQSFYVNMRYVVSLNTDGFTLKNGLSVPVSRSYKKAVKEHFMLWGQ